MKKEIIYLVGFIIVVFMFGILGWEGSKSRYENIVKIYDHTGLLGKQIKVWCDTATVTGSTTTVDYSSAGFSTVMSIEAIPEFSSATFTVLPIAEIKSYTTSQVVVNLLQSKTTTVSILGAVVDGLQALQSFSSTRIHVRVIGY